MLSKCQKILEGLKENDGATLKKYAAISYKTGWQVATSGVECATISVAMEAVKSYNGNCGIWFSAGIYYIDESKRVKTKREALTIGREHKQISVYGWQRSKLAYC